MLVRSQLDNEALKGGELVDRDMILVQVVELSMKQNFTIGIYR